MTRISELFRRGKRTGIPGPGQAVSISEERVTIDDQNPWPGLAAFDEASERFFNGRAIDTAELRRLIQLAPLTVLFAKSGLGKTSLIQAGLFPVLRKEHILPVAVRLDVRDCAAPLINQAKDALQNQFRKVGVEAPPFRECESLWEYLHRPNLEIWSDQNYLLTPLFAFDQFEEVFTLGRENGPAIACLKYDLADLIENRLPAALSSRAFGSDTQGDGTTPAGRQEPGLALAAQRYRILLSFREDFLPSMEEWKREIPSILRNRLRLLPMSGEQAFEAVHCTAPHLANDAIARRIVFFLAGRSGDSAQSGVNDEELSEFEIEPAFLSMVCQGLNEKRKQQNKTAFDETLLKGSAETIISEYYHKSLQDLPEQVQRFIEKELITERGFRRPYDTDDARLHYGITNEQLSSLVHRRLLRIVPQRGTEQVELTHDLLTGAVREHRNKQRELERARKQRTVAIVVLAIVAALVYCCIQFFVLYRKAQSAGAEAARQADEKQRLVKALQQYNNSHPATPNEPAPQTNDTASSFSVPELARLYNFPTELDGRGQTIGLVELGGGYTDSDLKAYFSQLKIPIPAITVVSVDGGGNKPGGSDTQVTGDIEMAGAIAPGAQIVVYFAPNTNQGFLNAVNTAIHDSTHRPSVISIAWGGPEQSWTSQYIQNFNNSLEAGVASGTTIVTASGNNGVTGLSGLREVEFPSSSPWVLTVGGTHLVASGGRIVSETVWNDGKNGGASGGGVSSIFPVPDWQSATKIPSLTDGHFGRAIPDVAVDAAPSSGYKVYVNGANVIAGGSSLSTPFWAGLVALMNQGLGRNVGYINPVLYQKLGPAGVFHAIIKGNNSFGGVTGYSAGPGWNACAGWGSPDGRKLLDALKKDLRSSSMSSVR